MRVGVLELGVVCVHSGTVGTRMMIWGGRWGGGGINHGMIN